MKSCTICFTSDTHGYLLGSQYARRTQSATGLLHCASAYEKDGNTLVLDGGDSLQGSPLIQYYMHRRCPWSRHPVAEAFNAAGYDAVTLGNHDFNYGYDALEEYLTALDAVCVCANVTDHQGRLPLHRYTIRTLENGLRVGITGIVTGHVNVWESPENLTFLTVSDPLPAARQALEEMRSQCDLTICLYHGGFERDLATGAVLEDTGENIGWQLCQELGFDLLLTAHQHMPLPGRWLHGTYTLQCAANAVHFARITASREPSGWQVQSELAAPAPSLAPAAQAAAQSLEPLEEKVQAWLDEPVGCLTEEIFPLSKLELACQGSRLADLFNQVQLDWTGADFSCAALSNDLVGLGPHVTMRDILAAYPFPNTLVVLEVTPQELKEALERCAAYYTLENGAPRISDCFVLPKVEHYNFEFLAGLEAVFDLRRPVGQRVVALNRDGSPLPDGTYTICMNNYRATGTGGYGVFRRCPVHRQYPQEMQELLADYIQRHSPVDISPQPPYRLLY